MRARRFSAMLFRRSLQLEVLESRSLLAAAAILDSSLPPIQLATVEPGWLPVAPAEIEPPAPPTSSNLVNWIASGPTAIFGGQTENVPGERVSGAVNALLLHPTNANIAWIGTVNGGIWKSTNATTTEPNWVPQTDQASSLSIGALTFDSADTTNNTLWAGIGRFSSLGQDGGGRTGLLKSTNGGTSWTSVASTALAGKNISGIYAKGSVVVVSVNVADQFTFPNIGIFRSTNGGSTFTQISTGGTTGLAGGVAYDLVYDPVNTNVLYTGIWGGTADGVYKSVNQGATWTRVSNAAINSRIGSATSNLELSVGKNNNVYLGVINQGVLSGLFRSGNGGSTWTELDNPKTNENGNLVGLHPRPKGPGLGATPSAIAGGQGNIHFSIVADPVNPNIVYVGGDRQPLETGPVNSIGARNFSGRLFRVDASKAAGSQAISLTHNPTTSSNSAPHADSRDMAFAANGVLVEVDDGGVYKRTNPRGVGDWFSMHGNLQNTEIHSIAYDSISNALIAGTQDVGTPVQRTNSTAWDELTQGDGGIVQVDSVSLAAQNRSVRYSAFFRLVQFRKTIYDASNQVVSVQNPALTVIGTGTPVQQFDSALPFYTPIVINSVNPARTLVLSNRLYESFDRFETLTQLAGGDSPLRAYAYGGAGNENVIYVGNSTGLFVRTAAGTSFNTITGYTGQEAVDIALDPDNWQSGVVVDSNQVFVFSGAGTTVNEVTGNLAALSGNAKIRTVAYTPGGGTFDGIIVGTDNGTYLMETNAPQKWEVYGANLPNTPVMDLRYDRTDDLLVAGTLGRGAWRVPAASQTLGNQPPVVTAGSATLSYTENAAPTRLAVDGTITDVDSANFASGYLKARVTVNGQATDQLSILNSGSITTNAAGQVLFSGTVIGTFTGGNGTNLFTVSLNASATAARVQSLLRNLSFSSSSNNPSTAQRTIVIQVGDGDGAQGAIARKLNVVAVNDAPIITPTTSTPIAYTLNSTTGALLLSNATLTDPDTTPFTGGILTVNVTAGVGSTNRIELGGRITISGNNILLDGTTVIGTRNANGGIGTTGLTITFNSSASISTVQLVLRALRFRTIGGSAGQRQLAFRLTDGEGGTSATINRTVNVA